jgi:hypothetical protein
MSSDDDDMTRKESELGNGKDSITNVVVKKAILKGDDDPANETTCPVCLEQIGTSCTLVTGC